MEGSPGAPGANVAVVSAAGRVHAAGSPGEVLLATRFPLLFPRPGRDCPRRPSIPSRLSLLCVRCCINSMVGFLNLIWSSKVHAAFDLYFTSSATHRGIRSVLQSI